MSPRPPRRVVIGHGRETDLRRRPPAIEQRISVLIVTNGEVTEPIYLRGLVRDKQVEGRFVVKFEAGSPRRLVEVAEAKRARDDFDEVWAVCDVDEFDVTEAHATAEDRSVKLVLSNPSFEVWLILHKDDCRAFVQDARHAEDKLRSLVPGWTKTGYRYESFRGAIAVAARRAESLGDPVKSNPGTAMWRVTKRLGLS